MILWKPMLDNTSHPHLVNDKTLPRIGLFVIILGNLDIAFHFEISWHIYATTILIIESVPLDSRLKSPAMSSAEFEYAGS